MITGRGNDGGGRSEAQGELRDQINPEPDGRTLISAEFLFQLQGLLAQFNRPELVTGFVDFPLARFSANYNAFLPGGKGKPVKRMNMSALALTIIRTHLRPFRRRR